MYYSGISWDSRLTHFVEQAGGHGCFHKPPRFRTSGLIIFVSFRVSWAYVSFYAPVCLRPLGGWAVWGHLRRALTTSLARAGTQPGLCVLAGVWKQWLYVPWRTGQISEAVAAVPLRSIIISSGLQCAVFADGDSWANCRPRGSFSVAHVLLVPCIATWPTSPQGHSTCCLLFPGHSDRATPPATAAIQGASPLRTEGLGDPCWTPNPDVGANVTSEAGVP